MQSTHSTEGKVFHFTSIKTVSASLQTITKYKNAQCSVMDLQCPGVSDSGLGGIFCLDIVREEKRTKHLGGGGGGGGRERGRD